MKRTTLCYLTFTLLLVSCGQAPQKETGDRGPASVSAPTLWGKPINPNTQDLLDEIENAPAGNYKSTYKESSN